MQAETKNKNTARNKLLKAGAAVAGIAGIAGMAFAGSGGATAGVLDDYVPVDNPSDYAATSMDHYGWMFFQTPDGRMCGIAPNGGQSGCDAVPYNAPPEVNQTVVSSWAAGSMIYSDVPTYTQPGGQTVLPEGRKLSHMGTECGMGYQGAVTCEVVAEHGFTLSTTYAVFH